MIARRADTLSPYPEAAARLAPQVAAAADQIERDRRLPPDLVEALADAGLFRMLVPASLGGGAADLMAYALAIETLAKADASTAWCVSQGAGSALIAAYLAHEPARDVFGDHRAVVAWGPGSGTFVETEGGYLLTGHWAFASGCHHATWLGGLGRLVDDAGQPRLGEDGEPVRMRLLFPASRVEFTDIWNVSGLRGTASDRYEVHELFVPRGYGYAVDATGQPLRGARNERGPLYAFPSAFPIGFASVALGIARSTLDAFLELAASKTPRGARSVLRENAVIQSQVARAEAGWRAARLFLHDAIAGAWDTAGPDSLIPLEQRVLVRLAATNAIHASAPIVDTVFHAAGATAIFASNPFERRFRDIHAVTQQVQGSQAHFESAGQFFLGLDPDTTWL